MRGGRAWLRAATVLGTVGAGVLFGALPAYADSGEVYIGVDPATGDPALYVEASADMAHDITVVSFVGGFFASDTAGVLTDGAGCQPQSIGVVCTDTGISKGYLTGGDLNDILGVRGTIDFVIEGGAGQDILKGEGSGLDALYGQDGNDWLIGDSGPELMVGGAGADMMVGKGGQDTVSYEGVLQPVTADPDGVRHDDGAAGEQDTIMADVENIIGGSGPDVLVGNKGGNTLDGGPGPDTLVGLDGDDTLLGGPGFDSLFGDGPGDPTGSPATLAVALPVREDDFRDVCVVGPDGGRTFGCEVLG